MNQHTSSLFSLLLLVHSEPRPLSLYPYHFLTHSLLFYLKMVAACSFRTSFMIQRNTQYPSPYRRQQSLYHHSESSNLTVLFHKYSDLRYTLTKYFPTCWWFNIQNNTQTRINLYYTLQRNTSDSVTVTEAYISKQSSCYKVLNKWWNIKLQAEREDLWMTTEFAPHYKYLQIERRYGKEKGWLGLNHWLREMPNYRQHADCESFARRKPCSMLCNTRGRINCLCRWINSNTFTPACFRLLWC
jgi:hypothetical protein